MAAAATRANEHPVRTDLRAFVPRGSLQWLRDEPGVRHRRVDASLVFVDISGFTAMSERLARLGPVGAEEVTDLLNQTFSRLLAVAYEDDGSLLKFGGDALLLQFDGDDHVARAVHAAWGMRRQLRELQPLASSAGQVRLRMSVGVHTGLLDQFLVGSSHRELLLVGAGATEVVRMEAASAAGQILVSPAVVQALGRRILVTPLAPGHLLRRPPDTQRVHASADARVAGSELASLLLSSQVRARLQGGFPQAEHRPSVIGFVRFLGVDDHLATRGPDATAAALEHLVDAVVDAGRPDDVCLLATDLDAGGGKFLLTAGVPTSQEFDGERMLRTLHRLAASERRLPLKIGVHYGPVYAGVVGPWFRHTYTIIGDAVNVAARVMGHARPGEILATPEVLSRSQALFTIDELPPFAVKGKKQPVTALRVGPVTATRVRRSRARFRLAGRQAELAVLLDAIDAIDAIDATRAGSGRLVQLLGPAGIGKSRLIDELHERRPDAELVMVGCSRHESATPYHAAGALVRSILRLPAESPPERLARAVARLAPELEATLPLLGDVVGIDVPDNDATRDLTAGFRAERTADAVSALLEAVLSEPAVLVVEDLHWVDPESHAVVLALARHVLPGRRWLLVLTSRHRAVLDPQDDFGEQLVELEPLTDEDARELVYAAVEDGLLSLDRCQQLLDKAGGNPFFLQELLFAGGDGVLPDSVDSLIQTQLDQLPPSDRELLGYAAVLGADVDVDLLEATTGISAAAQRRAFARLDAFLEPSGDDGFRFRHALVHDGAYGRLPFRRRQELHLAAAAALESRRDREHRPDLLALHTYHARQWERARRHALAAAEVARARFANLTAAEQYRHAIESARYVRGLAATEVAADWEHLGDALMRASAYDEAVAAYRQAKRLAGPARQVHLCGQIGQLRERQGRYGEALRWLSRALHLAAGGGDTARLLVESAVVRCRQGRPQMALALADRAAACVADVATQARISYVRAWTAMLLGRDAPEDRARSLALFEEADDLVGLALAYNIISMSAYYRGDWDEAAGAYERAATLRRRVGDEVAAAAANGNLGELLADQGHFVRARGLLEECRAVCGAAGFQSSRWFAAMTLGRLDARLGRYEEAEAQLRESLAALEAMNMPWLVFDAQRYLAELGVFRGDDDLALAQAAVLDASTALGAASFRVIGDRVRTCVLLGQGRVPEAAERAAALLAGLDDEARDYDTALSLVAVAEAFAAAGDPRAAPVRARGRSGLDRLGVVVPGELLVFGPTSRRPDLVGA